MNTTSQDTADGLLPSYRISSYAYGVGLSIGILLLILTLTLASLFCTRAPDPAQSRNRRRSRLDPNNNNNIVILVVEEEAEAGLDEDVIQSYPKTEFSNARDDNNNNNGSSCGSCCSICLADYRNSDMLRLLPDCNHLFHVKCVDPWLRLHPTCPVCRNSLLPTPLAEVVPLAGGRD